MLYQPNFCCQCGEKIDRHDWKFWTSRKFCAICDTEFVWHKYIPAACLAIGALGLFYGFGSYLKKPDKPLPLTTNQISSAANKNPQNPSALQLSSANNFQNIEQKSAVLQSPEIQANAQAASPQKMPHPTARVRAVAANRQNSATEAVYYCGARTKKGTPCTRRVRGGGRCWQHTGLPAILPPEKLFAGQ